ncbi:DUF4429 domain-containing protein [Streptomyces violens]|uniref:DUF4429 domain-containing protein n=1 Tax=Streptomyces violens TaxID=66377 RepID=UPI0004C176AC|nr:DUF4429 domain-containing protein [Streptomyces violens]
MGDVLAGFHAVWEFDTDSVLIRFERGIRKPKLFQALGERRIPYEALSSVRLSRGRRGTVVLHARPRPGADPLMDAADGQLKDDADPYRLVLPADRADRAEYYRDRLTGLLGPDAAAEQHLVAAPEPPLTFKAYDGKASFDGSSVAFRWFWTGASSAKWKSGDQSFPVDGLSGVVWRSPENGSSAPTPPGAWHNGYLRLLAHGAEEESRDGAEQDPASVIFGLGYGPVHESLPFAAAVLQAVRSAGPAPAPAPQCRPLEPHRGPADIADRIRQLGELHDAGLLTDAEFSAKKAELLAEL